MNRNRPTTWHLSASSLLLGLQTLMISCIWRVRCAKTRTLTLATHRISPVLNCTCTKIYYNLWSTICVQKKALCAHRPDKLSVSAARQVRANAAPNGIGLGKDLTPPKGAHGTFTARCVMHVMGRAVAPRLSQRSSGTTVCR